MAMEDDLDDLLGLDKPAAKAPEAATDEPEETAVETSSEELDNLLGEETGRPAVLDTDPEPESPVVDEPAEPESPVVDEPQSPPAAAEEPEAAQAPEDATPVKKGRRTHAQIEAELRVSIEAELRAKIAAEQAAALASEIGATGSVTEPDADTFDDSSLLDGGDTVILESNSITIVKAPDVSQMDEADVEKEYLASLQARIKGDPVARPKPESELTPVQRQIRAAEDQLTRIESDRATNAAPSFEERTSADVLLIHIVNDGLAINGQPVYRGQEFEFDLHGRAYEQTKNKFGVSYLDLVDDINAQYERWGEQKIGRGPWMGKRENFSVKDAPSELTGADREQWVADMIAHQKAESRRSKAAPVMVGNR